MHLETLYYSLKVTKGHFDVYFNLNLRSYGQLFVLVIEYVNKRKSDESMMIDIE